MPPADLAQALRKRPFEPFQLLISDGSKYEIRHPELLMVGLGSVIIGIPATDEQPPMYARVEAVDTRHIVKMIPLGVPVSPGNGEPQGQ